MAWEVKRLEGVPPQSNFAYFDLSLKFQWDYSLCHCFSSKPKAGNAIHAQYEYVLLQERKWGWRMMTCERIAEGKIGPDPTQPLHTVFRLQKTLSSARKRLADPEMSRRKIWFGHWVLLEVTQAKPFGLRFNFRVHLLGFKRSAIRFAECYWDREAPRGRD